MSQVVDDMSLMGLALMNMAVRVMVIDTEDTRAVGKHTFSVISRGF